MTIATRAYLARRPSQCGRVHWIDVLWRILDWFLYWGWPRKLLSCLPFVLAWARVRLWTIARRLTRRPDYPFDRSYGHGEQECRAMVAALEGRAA